MASGRPDYRHGQDLEAQAIDRISTITKSPTGTDAVFKSHIATNATGVLHSVTTGKTLFLTAATLAVSSLDVSGIAYLAVRDDNDDIQYYLLRQNLRATTDNSANAAYSVVMFPPIEIAADWDIIVLSPHDDISASASISGWEE